MNEPKIIEIENRKLIGMKIKTTLSENKTLELWQNFKPRVTEIENRTDTDFYSVQIFEKGLNSEQLTPQTEFEKWAAVQVESLHNVPDELEKFTIPSGKYAVFVHRGTPQEFAKTSAFIYGVWLPNSEFELDGRPHFEVMSANYHPADPNAEEEIWIPIKKKNLSEF
ncbi:MAG: GyrI-like domain-containing protein [Pyrinomonadaceae bacterium]|nr:GyrI-like domain-containing protein [Pyrinomonadaceae bacterium]